MFFAVDQKVLDILPEENIDIFLQNLVNRGSHYFHTFNILTIYFGWSLALSNHTLNATTIQNFIDKEYRLYDGKMEYHSIILLTTTQFIKGNSSVTGRATINSMCKIKKYGIYVMYRKGRDEISKRNQVKTLIHEIGHQFGIQHINKTECSGKEPPDVVWIMRSATNKPGPLKWSPCSKRYMRKNRHLRSCLRMEVNPYKPFCGDGLVEDGEECDCIVKECRKCCNKKCRLKERSKCSNGLCCDVSTCTFIEGIQCRAAHDSCDIPELCDGKSRKCPPNYVVANGYRCGNEPGDGYCFNGRCGSHQDVCNWIYVVGHIAKEECYDENSEKDSNLGGCGPVFPDTGSNMLKCEEKDKYCGKIWCENEKSSYTKEFEAIREMEILQDVREKRHNSCSTLVFKEGGRIRMDPTFVQNGSECGNGKMCIQQACVPLPKGCPKNCPGIKIVHPYTKEELPAFILNEPDPGKRDESPQDNFFLIYVITISFTISMLISTFYMHTSEGEEDPLESAAATEIHPKEEEENSLPEIHQPDHSQQDSVETPSTLPPQVPNMDITQETLVVTHSIQSI